MNDIRAIVKGITGLRPLPKAIHQVMAVAQEQDIELHKLSEAISCDPILTANVLKQANSAFYGRSGKFNTVHQAVVFMGAAEVVNIVMMAVSRDQLSGSCDGYDLSAGQLWLYSLSSAHLAKAVSARKKIDGSQVVFTAALIKDIGKTILSQYVREQHLKIRALVAEQGLSFREAEKMVLGIDHAELGALVALTWRFSPQMVDMIRHHHQPLLSKRAPLQTAAVYMGDILCMILGAGLGADGLAYRFQPEVIDFLKITEKEIQIILMEFEDRMQSMQAMFGN